MQEQLNALKEFVEKHKQSKWSESLYNEFNKLFTPLKHNIRTIYQEIPDFYQLHKKDIQYNFQVKALNERRKLVKLWKDWNNGTDDVYLYIAPFYLDNYVRDEQAAANWLIASNLADYSEYKDKLYGIWFALRERDCGTIFLYTKELLSNDELDDLNDELWGQIIDGIGEGFEQQDFATDDQAFDEESYNKAVEEYENREREEEPYELDFDSSARFSDDKPVLHSMEHIRQLREDNI